MEQTRHMFFRHRLSPFHMVRPSRTHRPGQGHFLREDLNIKFNKMFLNNKNSAMRLVDSSAGASAKNG